MASDSSSGFFSFLAMSISYFFTDTQNTTEMVEKKRTNEQTQAWVSSKRKREIYNTFVPLPMHL